MGKVGSYVLCPTCTDCRGWAGPEPVTAGAGARQPVGLGVAGFPM